MFTHTGPAGPIAPSEERVVFFRSYFPREGRYSIDPVETIGSLTGKA